MYGFAAEMVDLTVNAFLLIAVFTDLIPKFTRFKD